MDLDDLMSPEELRRESAAVEWARSIPLTRDQKRAAIVLLSLDNDVDVIGKLMVIEKELEREGLLS